MTETENSRTSSRGGGNVAKHGAVERGPFSFVLGEGSLIRGWEEGLVGMCVGEVRKLTVPRAMAYTRYADPEDSPMGKGLVYEIELLELHKP
jgi:FK506-binding protein 2